MTPLASLGDPWGSPDHDAVVQSALEDGRNQLVPRIGEQVTQAVRSMVDSHWLVGGGEIGGSFVVLGFMNHPYSQREYDVEIDGVPYAITVTKKET